MELQIERVTEGDRREPPKDVLKVPFGTVFTDHMLSMSFQDGKWNEASIHGFRPLSLSPAALCLHYGQGIFEGMKAYRTRDRILLFRPEKNFERMNISADRMVMPKIDSSFALESLKELLRIDRDWIPTVPGSSLYVRPTMIATQPKLGVKPSSQYLYYVILSPVGPYFKEGFSPVKIYVSTKHVRAAEGGVGAAKTMGNYAASLYAGTKAAEVGTSQVLWLDAHERKWLEEMGTSNVFVKLDDEVVTPPLSDTILHGITRDSVITLLRDYGHKVNERPISIDEVIEGIESNKVDEMFGCGTAAIIAPIGSLWHEGSSHEISGGQTGRLTQKLFNDLTGIQSGRVQDSHGWVLEVD
ncbi:branched-chain amino acid aminotransferase [Candidatus Thorarchaeota archaeon]|jgi:branched-chain amino acid aminotransferase|nr:MAG: branched-chain amino acid aminotransferase [Candidatus Thorarchaeota archaeon]